MTKQSSNSFISVNCGTCNDCKTENYQECDYRNGKCINCDEKHDGICPQGMYRCSYCDIVVKYEQLNDHGCDPPSYKTMMP